MLVKAPLRAELRQIEGFLASKQSWIDKNAAICKDKTAKKADFSINYNSSLRIFGKTLPIMTDHADKCYLDELGFHLPPRLDEQRIKSQVKQLYGDALKKHLEIRVPELSRAMKLFPTVIRINNARSQWGSCSSNRSISFSWLLVMASPEVVDYVIIHELAHLSQHNHSAKFWSLVEAYCPDYKANRESLRALQLLLSTETW